MILIYQRIVSSIFSLSNIKNESKNIGPIILNYVCSKSTRPKINSTRNDSFSLWNSNNHDKNQEFSLRIPHKEKCFTKQITQLMPF